MQEHPKLSLRRLWASYGPYVRRYPLLLTIIVVGSAVSSFGDLFHHYLFKLLIDAFAEGKPIETVVYLVWAIVALGIAEVVVRRSFEVVNAVFQPAIKKDLADGAMRYLVGHSHRFFADHFAGSLVKQLMRYIDSFEEIADHITFYFLPVILQILITMGMLWFVHPWFTFVLGAWVIIFTIIVLIFNQYKSRLDIAESVAWTRNTGFVADVIGNQSAVKAAGTEECELRNFDGLTNESKRREVRSWIADQILNTVQAVLMIGFEAVVLFLFVHLWKQGQLTAGDAVLLIGITWQLFIRLWELGNTLRRFYGDSAYAMEMIELLDLDHEVKDKRGARPIVVKHGAIECTDISFRYRADTKPVFDGFSLSLKAGEKVALVGQSGGGKSTIVKLLQRLYDIQSGVIEIDGQNIADVTQQSLRSQIALVPQDPVLFHRSIAENIAYECPRASMHDIQSAAAQAHADVFIDQLPQGYDTLVGERGVKLSGGERQRIAIARAMLANRPIVILDEATSSLDSQSEKLIQDALQKLFKNRTVIVIAHRLSTIKEVDRIIVLQQGAIVEQGSHSQLLRKKNGVYRKLYELQAGGFIGE